MDDGLDVRFDLGYTGSTGGVGALVETAGTAAPRPGRDRPSRCLTQERLGSQCVRIMSRGSVATRRASSGLTLPSSTMVVMA